MKSHALVKIRNHLHGFPIRRRDFKRPRMMYARACTRDLWTVTLGQQTWVQRALQVLRPSSRSTGTTSSSRSYTRRSPCWSTSIHADEDRSKRKREANSTSPCLKRKALIDFCAQQDALGRPIRIEYVPSIAFSLACQRTPADRPIKSPGKNWAQLFQKRHAGAIRASKSGALDWNRFGIYDKVNSWFDVIGKVLQDPAVLQENVYNMDETGIMLSKLNSVKVLARTGDDRGYRGARVKRTTITAVECISASGEALDPMIIWPASTHQANWTTQSTPG